jgi:hypothetical protein
VSAAVEATLRRLHGQLSRLVGPVGLLALLMRAVHLAKKDFPWVAELEFRVGSEVAVVGLGACVEREGSQVVLAGCGRVLAHLLGLLCTFIGEDLTLRLLRREWPELPHGGTPTGSGEASS